MDPAEVEFIAEKEMITIVPNFTLDKIYLISVSNVALSLLNFQHPKLSRLKGHCHLFLT